jgi:hypothetical protein
MAIDELFVLRIADFGPPWRDLICATALTGTRRRHSLKPMIVVKQVWAGDCRLSKGQNR